MYLCRSTTHTKITVISSRHYSLRHHSTFQTDTFGIVQRHHKLYFLKHLRHDISYKKKLSVAYHSA